MFERLKNHPQTLKLSNLQTLSFAFIFQQNSGWTSAPDRSRYPSATAGYNRICSAIGDPWRAESKRKAISRRWIVLRMLFGSVPLASSVQPVTATLISRADEPISAGAQFAGLVLRRKSAVAT